MTTSQQTKLITMLKTLEKANLLKELLLTVTEEGYIKKNSLIKKIEKLLPLDLQTGLFSYFQSEKIDVAKKESLLTAVKDIVPTISKFPSVTITVAIEPNYALEAFLFDEVAKISESPLLVDIRYNPDLIGGAVIQHNGLYKDYSLERTMFTL